MNLQDHESTIRNKMLQHREVIDPNEVWHDLEPQLHPKKKRRVLFFWLFGGLGLALLSTLWLTQSSSLHITLEAENNDYTTTQKVKEINTNELNNNKSESIEEGTSTSLDQQTNESPNRSKILTSNQVIIKENTTTKNDQQLKAVVEHPANDPATNISNMARVALDKTNSKTKYIQDNTARSNSTQPITNNSINISTEYNYSENGTKLDNKTPYVAETYYPSTQIIAKPEIKTFDLFSSLPILMLNTLNFKKPTIVDSETKLAPSLLEPSKRSSNKIELFTSFGWGNLKSTYSSINVDDQEYIDQLNQINQGISSQHAKLGLRYYLKDCYMESGIEYNRFVNRTKLYQVSTIDTMINGTQATYYRKSGDVEVTQGQVPAVRQRTQDIQWHTYRHLIDLPISIGYEKDFRRFSFGVQAGISINLSQRAEGAYISQAGRLVKFNSTSALNPYQMQYGLSYTGGLHVAYHLNPSMKLQFSGNYRSFPTRTIQFEQKIKENIKSGQLNIGIFYRL